MFGGCLDDDDDDDDDVHVHVDVNVDVLDNYAVDDEEGKECTVAERYVE